MLASNRPAFGSAAQPSSTDASTLEAMPYRLPTEFPNQLSGKELDAAVTNIVTNLRERYGDDVGTWLPELQLALVTVAVSEQSRRQLVSSSRIAISSLLVAAAALAVAIITNALA